MHTENQLATIGAQSVSMTSLEIVDIINANRQEGAAIVAHSDFLKKVPIVLNGDEGKFSSVYTGGNGQQRPCYAFPKREACLMAMSYSYALQGKVYDRMTALESEQRFNGLPNFLDPADAALAWAAEFKAKQAAQLALAEAQPKIELVDNYIAAKGNRNFREVAKALGVPQKQFIAMLMKDDVIFRQADKTLMPFAHHVEARRFEVHPLEARGRTRMQTRITPPGFVWLEARYGAKRKSAKIVEAE